MNTTDISEELTVGAIVAKDIRNAEVFKKHGIDFCCGGKQTLKQACADAGIREQQILDELKQSEFQSAVPSMNFNSWSLDFLTTYIINTHHAFVKSNIVLIHEIAEKVSLRHGETHPETIELAAVFNELANEMTHHMMKEEQILFPYINDLASLQKDHKQLAQSRFGSIQNPIRMMENEHEMAGNHLETISKLTNNFNPPADACTSFCLLYNKFKEFDGDLHQHVHLENNILFPKALELEQQLLG